MRKRNCKNLFDNIMWYTIYLLPIILTILATFGAFQGDWYVLWQEIDGDWTSFPFFPILHGYLDNFLYFDLDVNPIFLTFNNIFGNAGLLPCFNTTILLYMTYFVYVYLFHLIVDFLLFIPRLAHKWMNSFTRSDD